MDNKCIYIRFSTGLGFEKFYDPNKTIKSYVSQCLISYYGPQSAAQIDTQLHNIEIIFNGKNLQLDKNLIQNQVKQASILHIYTKNIQKNTFNVLKISFYENVFQIQYNQNQRVYELKKMLEREIDTDLEQLMLIFQSKKLEDGKFLSQYEIKSGDLLSLIIVQTIKPIVFQVPSLIYPKKNKNPRRHSIGDADNFDEKKPIKNKMNCFWEQVPKSVSPVTPYEPQMNMPGVTNPEGCSFSHFDIQKWMKPNQLNNIENFQEQNSINKAKSKFKIREIEITSCQSEKGGNF